MWLTNDFVEYYMYLKTSFYSVHSQSIYITRISRSNNSARSESIYIERQYNTKKSTFKIVVKEKYKHICKNYS